MVSRTTVRDLINLLWFLLFSNIAYGETGWQNYDVVVEHNIMVAMRDGVHLATDVYRPAVEGKAVEGACFPVILLRTPYGKGGPGKFFAQRRYVYVAQDTRGRGKSEGLWHMLADDGPDGVDTAAWIAKQSWSNGRIGMMGTSYVGGTQHALAMAQAPELATVMPVDAMSNLGYHGMRNNGAFELRFWNWIMRFCWSGANHDTGATLALRQMDEHRLWYLENLPLRAGTTPLRLAPAYEQWLVHAMREGTNSAFWKQNNIIDHAGQYKDIPVYLVGGWYDSWGASTTANYMALSDTIKGPVYLIMGPWIHGAQSQHAHGQVNFGAAAAIGDEWAWRAQWFDHWLKGKDNAVGKAAPFATRVRIFVMGIGDGSRDDQGRLMHGGYWRDEDDWPLARTQYRPFYLHEDGSLEMEPPDEVERQTTYDFDPHNPVPTVGGQISSGWDIMLAGAYNQRGGDYMPRRENLSIPVWRFQEPAPLSARRDVLVFQSDPLEANLEVTGEIAVKLWVSSSALDTDFTAKLVDVYPPSEHFPDGFDLLLGDGIIRARFRESLTYEKLMEPGEVYETTIKLYPTSNIFKKGHRIRVDISSSNFPRFDVNPNTGEPLNQHRRMVTATNTIWHDRGRPSHILLPVIPPRLSDSLGGDCAPTIEWKK
jgi:putative CocE/NonD family hydrolase